MKSEEKGMKSASDRVKAIIMEQFYLEADRVDMNASIRDDLGADSLDCVELVIEVEEEFGVEIPEEDAEGMRTGADMVAWLEKRNF